MKISLWSGLTFNTYADLLVTADIAVTKGYDGMWMPQTLSLDSISALAVVADHHDGLNVGVAVVPMQSRSPFAAYLSARGLGESFGGERVTLGLGASHPGVSEAHYGLPYADAVSHAEEYLEILSRLRADGRSGSLSGRFYDVDITVPSAGETSRVLLAALGPKMLRLAAMYCDGTVTWMTGPRTLAAHTAPKLREFAEAEGRHGLEIVACLPVCVTDDPATAEDALRERMQSALNYRSYRRQLEMEGVDDIAAIGLIGDEAHLGERISALEEIGVTEIVFDVFGSDDEVQRTHSFVATSNTQWGSTD